MSDNEFVRQYEAYDEEALQGSNGGSRTAEEYAALLDHLTRTRERLSLRRLDELDVELGRLERLLSDVSKQRTLEETRCFRDVAALQDRRRRVE